MSSLMQAGMTLSQGTNCLGLTEGWGRALLTVRHALRDGVCRGAEHDHGSGGSDSREVHGLRDRTRVVTYEG